MSYTVIKIESTDGSVTISPVSGVGVVDLSAAPADTVFRVVNKSANYTAVSRDCVLSDATVANFVVTLPPVSLDAIVTVKKTDVSAHTVTVTPASGVIDGAATFVVNAQYESVTVVSDGANWFIV